VSGWICGVAPTRQSEHMRCVVQWLLVVLQWMYRCVGGGFPNAKLSSLQKVLSSDFFSAVREVYEHVYETVDLSGSVEVRANATAKVSSATTQSLSLTS